MQVIRKLISAILVALVGLVIASIISLAATIFVFGLGIWIGAPVGLTIGAMRGYKTPLRDAIILFVSCFGCMAIGVRLAAVLGEGMPKDNLTYWFMPWYMPALGAIVGVVMVYMGLLAFVPFERRRTPAGVLGIAFALWICWRVYFALWVWEQ